MVSYQARFDASSKFVQDLFRQHGTPKVCVVMGSGLAAALPPLQNAITIPYAQVPGFQAPTVPGHPGELRIGTLQTKDGSAGPLVVFLCGRSHLYEGIMPEDVVHNLRVILHEGVEGVVLTNASGCLETSWQLGNIMMIQDHINQTGTSPLEGTHNLRFGPQFVNMTEAYTPSWQQAFHDSAARANVTLYEGVYFGVHGPCYETPAEIRMMKHLGAHAVGMSTVLEAIAAAQMKKKLAALACLTNYGAGLKGAVLEHQHVMQMGKQFSANMIQLLLAALPQLK